MNHEVTFLIGRSGSGKTRWTYRRIRELFLLGERPVLLVPEQFTFETERMLSEYMGGGLLGIRVLSFTTLAQKVLASTGCRKTFLSREGRRMVIRKVAREKKHELTAFAPVAEKRGFAAQCDSFFSLCKRFELSPEALSFAAESLGRGSLLGDKLRDFSLLYAGMEEYLKDRYLDGDDTLTELVKRLPESDLANRDVFVNGFDLLTAQLYSVLGALMETAHSVTFSVRMDENPSAPDADVFLPEKRAYEKLREMAEARGCAVRVISLPREAPDEGERAVCPEMRFLERELFSHGRAEYEGECPGITLFAATSPQKEIEELTSAVQRAAQSGIRYREMAVLASDMGSYAPAIKRAFSAEGIPLFTDATHPVTGHPAAELLLSALRFLAEGYSKGDLLRIAKCGLAGTEDSDTEVLENYLLQYGVNGSALLSPFTRGEVPEEAERARTVLIEPLLRLREGMKSRSAAEKTRALYAYLEELHVPEALDALTREMAESERFEEAEETAQVYNMIIELMDQLHMILGELKTNNKEYLALFSEGIEAYEIGVIPTTVDQVLLGGVSRTRSRSVRTLFVVGAAAGKLPAQHADDAVVDDAELAHMTSIGLVPWGNTLSRMENDRLDLYGALSRASERLYLSYSMSNEDGSPNEPSEVYDRVCALFPKAKRTSDVGKTDLEPASLALSRVPFVTKIREYADTGNEAAAPGALYAALSKADPEFLRATERALFYSPSPKPLSEEIARELYGTRIRTSATRLETFNRCPFRHFAAYGLMARPRREYSETPLDEGTFCHDALEAFVNAVLARGIEWGIIDEARARELLSELLPDIVKEHNHGILLENGRMRFLLSGLIDTLSVTCCALSKQIARGEFRPTGTEVEFGFGKDLPPLRIPGPNGTELFLSGKIDRTDAAECGGETLYRVIDYKRGGKKFDYAELLNGIALQLPLYLAASRAAYRSGRFAGMYYFPVKNPAEDGEFDSDALEAAVLREFRLSGLTLSDASVYRASDADLKPGKSPVLPSIQSGGYLEENEMERVLTFAREKAGETLTNIYRGEADISPAKKRGQTSPCEYCDYKGACGFDEKLPGCRKRVLSALKKDEFFASAGEEKPHE